MTNPVTGETRRALPPTRRVLRQVGRERARQDELWGEQNHQDGTGPDLPASFRGSADNAKKLVELSIRLGLLTWRHILLEEVAEAMEAPDVENLRDELVQVAAVATAWVEAIDRRAT